VANEGYPLPPEVFSEYVFRTARLSRNRNDKAVTCISYTVHALHCSLALVFLSQDPRKGHSRRISKLNADIRRKEAECDLLSAATDTSVRIHSSEGGLIARDDHARKKEMKKKSEVEEADCAHLVLEPRERNGPPKLIAEIESMKPSLPFSGRLYSTGGSLRIN
jgi:hypothetical protein